jgi:predicted nucleic acid-binding protein
MNLVDTSGWLEFFFGAPNASYFAGPIENPEELLVPVICLYEVFKKINEVADENRALRAIAQMKQGIVVDVTEEVALQAAVLSAKHRMPMADSLIFATGQAAEAAIWTQDEHFRGLPNVNFKAARKAKTRNQKPNSKG